MKRYLLIFSIALMSFTISNDEPIDRIDVIGPLKFNRESFQLAWSDNPNGYYYIQEYLPKKEKVENFNQMLTIHLFDKEISIKDAVSQKIEELKERKKTDITCNYKVIQSPDNKEYIVDFLLGESSGNQMTIAEFNIYRYKEVDLGNRKGILVYAYSKRSYGENIKKFYTNLREDRTELLNAMVTSQMPNVKLSKKE